jgi:predicted metal-dependent phosphoesterase TrpH
MKNAADLCDLHIHSHYSDGTLPPAELVRKAGEIGLGACSITDHDSVEGQREALREGAGVGIEVIEGVEFSVHVDDQDIHILGYLIDIDDEELGRELAFLGEARLERAREIVSRLADSGLEIPFSEVVELSGKGTIGRPHIAQVLFSHGLVSCFQAAFGRYIGEGRPCYVPKTVLPLGRVVDLIRNAGGVPVWAHPGDRVRNRPLLDEILEAGVAGLEAYHPNHDPSTAQEIEMVARRRDLVTTGGSDYHFYEAKQIDIGGVTAPYSTVSALRAAVI